MDTFQHCWMSVFSLLAPYMEMVPCGETVILKQLFSASRVNYHIVFPFPPPNFLK